MRDRLVLVPSIPQLRHNAGVPAGGGSLRKEGKRMLKRNKTLGQKIRHVMLMLTVTMTVSMMGLASAPISNMISENASATGYPFNYQGDPYILLGTGWNLVTFYGIVSFTAYNVFGMELNPDTKESIDTNWHNTIDQVLDMDQFGERGHVWVSKDTFDLWHMHYHKIGADFSFQAGRSYWIHCLAPCAIYAPSYVNNGVMYTMIHGGGWNSVGVIGEDGFWYAQEDRYKWASEMRWSLRYASNCTQYMGWFEVRFVANGARTEANITIAPDPDTGYSDWGNGDGGYAKPEWAVYEYESAYPYDSCNFAVSDPYYTDHSGLLLWTDYWAGDLYWIFWPGDATVDSPWYST